MKVCEETWGLEIKEISRVKGSELTDIVLEHPYLKRDSILIHGDHVTIETGTGCVHTAPAHGIDDYFAVSYTHLTLPTTPYV